MLGAAAATAVASVDTVPFLPSYCVEQYSSRNRLPEPPQNLLDVSANAATPYTMHCALFTNVTITMLLVVVAARAVATAEAAQLPG